MPKKQKIVMSKNEQEQHKTRSVSEYSSPFCWQLGIAVQPHRGHFGGSYKAWRMLLLLLSHISRVRLCATPQTAAHQAPPSLGFSREETGVGCHFLQCVKVKSLSRVRLLVTPWTAAYEASPSMGVSRQKYWSGLPLPSPEGYTYPLFQRKWH